MTEDGKFVSKQDFAENATEKDYMDLWNTYKSKGGSMLFPTKKDPRPDFKYQFGATSAKELLDKWQEQKAAKEQPTLEGQPVQKVKLTFTEEKQDFRKHSLLITEEQWNRLQALYDKYPVMGKQYVLHAFLEYSLTRLGV